MKEELARAYRQHPWPVGQIGRLIQEIAATEQAISLQTAPRDSELPVD